MKKLLSHYFWVIRRFLGKGQFLDSFCRVTESISDDFVAWLSFVQFMMSRDFCDVVKTSRDNDFQYSAFVFVNAKWDEVSKKGWNVITFFTLVYWLVILMRPNSPLTNHHLVKKCSKLIALSIFMSHHDFGNNWMKKWMRCFSGNSDVRTV